ncbi:MAG: hypothetical protein QXK26_04200 [Candidatus Bathyarchaeia archaeon]
MVSLASSHLYMFLATVAVGTILISAFNSYSTTLRSIPEEKQLRNLLEYVASEGNKLVTLTLLTNSSESLFLNLPSKIGANQYWIRIRNDSTSAWLEGCLGQSWNGTPAEKVYFPCRFSASGHYLSQHGVARLECYMNGRILQSRLPTQGGA